MAELERSEVLHRNPVTQRGFTMIPNAVLTASRLSSGARLLYGLLKMHAWQDDNAYPGQERLAEYLGVSTRQVRTYQTELEQAGLITVEQRGLRQTNRYWIEDIPAGFLSDRNSTSDQDRKPTSDQDRNSTSDKEDAAVKKTQQKKRENAPAPVTGDIPRTEPIDASRDMAPIRAGMPVNERPDAPKLRAVPKFAQTPEFAATLTALLETWPLRDGAGPNRKLTERALVLVDPRDYPALLAGAKRYAASKDVREGVIKNCHAWVQDEDWTRYTAPAPKPRPAVNPQLAELERRRAAQVRGVS